MNALYSDDEMMTVAAARMLRNGAVCFVGIGLPSTAANLARLTHAPDVVLIYESGPIGAKPPVLPLSIGDGNLAETADTVVSTPEIFRYWLQGGRVDVGFLGAAQLDRFANINTTVVGSYTKPKVRLPGAGGAPEISSSANEVLIIMKHSKRALVDKVDFVTSVGFLTGGDAREKLGLPGEGTGGGDYQSVHSSAQSPITGVGGCEHASGSGSSDDQGEYRVEGSILRTVRRDRSSGNG